MKKTSSSVICLNRGVRTGNSGRGRTIGAGLSSAQRLAHLTAKRGWVINPRTGLREAIA